MKLTENKPHSIHLRLTESQYAFCVENAEILGVGVADYVRIIVNSTQVASTRIAEKLGDLKNANYQNNLEHQLQQ